MDTAHLTLDDENTPTSPPSWHGLTRDADDTRPLPPPTARPVDASTLPPVDASRPTTRRGYLPAGMSAAAEDVRGWLTRHEDQWMLESLQRDAQAPGGSRFIPNYIEHRDRIRAEMQPRKWALSVVLLVLVVAIVVGLIAATWFTLIFGTALSLLGLWLYGWRAVNRPAPAVPLPALPVGAAPTAEPVELLDPQVARFVRPLRHWKLIKDNETVEILDVVPMGNGTRTVLQLPLTTPARDVVKKRHEIATHLGTVDRLLILETVDWSNSVVSVWECSSDPLAGPAVETHLMNVDEVNVWEGIKIGQTIRGDDVVLDLIGTHGLFGGDTNSGKSFTVRLPVLAVAKDPHAALMLFDPQGLGIWRAFSAIGEYHAGRSPDEIREMAKRLTWVWETEFERRRKKIEEFAEKYPWRCPESKLTEDMARDPELGLPFLLIVIDECHTLFTATTELDPDDERDKRTCGQVIRRAAQEIVSRGRGFGVGLICITQKASGGNIPTDIRDIFTTRGCLAVRTDASAKMVLGDDYATTGMDPVSLNSRHHKGVLYLTGEGLKEPDNVDWVLMRSEYADGNNATVIMRDALELRRRVRPQLLPVASRGGAATLVELAPNDPEHLERIVAVFAEGETALRSQTIIDRLQAAHPSEYGDLTPLTMNAFLRPFDGLETEELNRNKHRGLYLRTVVNALEVIESRAAGGRGEGAAGPRQ